MKLPSYALAFLLTFTSATNIGPSGTDVCRTCNSTQLKAALAGFSSEDRDDCFRIIVKENQYPELLDILLERTDDSITSFIDVFEFVCLNGSPKIIQAYLDNIHDFEAVLYDETYQYAESARTRMAADAIVFHRYMREDQDPMAVYVSEMIFHLINLLREGLAGADQVFSAIEVLATNASGAPELLSNAIHHVRTLKDLSRAHKQKVVNALSNAATVEKGHDASRVARKVAPKRSLRKRLARRWKLFSKS